MINAIPERNLPVLNFVYINLTICSTCEHQTVQTMLMVNNHLQCTFVRSFSQKPPDFVNSFIPTKFAYDCNVFSFLRDINWKITKTFWWPRLFYLYVVIIMIIIQNNPEWNSHSGISSGELERTLTYNTTAEEGTIPFRRSLLSPPQRPLCVVGRLGRKKKRARGERWEGWESSPARFLFFRLF